MIIFGTNYELFLPPYQITIFLAFGQSKIFFNYHILMTILIYIRIIFSLNCKKHFKIRKEHVLLKCFFNKALPYLLYCKAMVKAYYIKGVHRIKKRHLFVDVLQNICS